MRKIIQKIKKHLTRKLAENDITMQELEELRKRGITIIDVRSTQEFQEGHIDGAISIPEYEIIVYCTSGQRSKKAKQKLEKLGYKKVYNLYNGLENY